MLRALLFFATSVFLAPRLQAQIYQDPTQPIDARIADLISRMTLQEKATELYYAGSSNARLGIPYFGGWNQCSHGVSCTSPTTLFPISIAAAATWSPSLITTEANAISDEARALNQEGASSPGNGALGLIFRAPVINISRNPFWGRSRNVTARTPGSRAASVSGFSRACRGLIRVISKSRRPSSTSPFTTWRPDAPRTTPSPRSAGFTNIFCRTGRPAPSRAARNPSWPP